MSHGDGPECFSLDKDCEVPVPMGIELLIRVHACSIGDVDWHIWQGCSVASQLVCLPAVCGFEIAGVVAAVGPLVDPKMFNVGDEIVCLASLDCRLGGHAQYSVQPAPSCCRKPSGVPFGSAAAVLAVGVRAYTALHYCSRCVAGDTVLVLDGGHAAGSIAMQLAVLIGARVITTASSSEEAGQIRAMLQSLKARGGASNGGNSNGSSSGGGGGGGGAGGASGSGGSGVSSTDLVTIIDLSLLGSVESLEAVRLRFHYFVDLFADSRARSPHGMSSPVILLLLLMLLASYWSIC